LIPRLAESVYGVVASGDVADERATAQRREAIRRERAERSVPVSRWLASERERILANATEGAEHFIPAVQRMYAESMRLSPRWAAECRAFWDLPDDFGFDIQTPTVDISERLLAGRDPHELQRQPRTEAALELPTPMTSPGVEAVSEELLESLLDGGLPGPQVRQIQSGYKDTERFETYLHILQRRWPFAEDTVLLPLGLHLCIVQLRDGRRVVKSDSGHVFGDDYRTNWKLGARIRIRNTVADLLEIYPEKMHPDPDWNEIREYYDPVSFTVLDVESVPPGYPIVHDFQPDLDTFYAEWLGRPLEERGA
jgi:acetone carboxylase gamma subunit